MENSLSIFFQVFAALWLVGGAIAIGLYQAIRNRWQGILLVGYIYAIVFSWIYVGWIAGKMYTWTVAGAKAQVSAAAVGKRISKNR